MSSWNNTSLYGHTTWNYRKVERNNFNRYSAGILPYTFDQQGTCLFLLGKDNDNDWSDFGGRCEFKDKNSMMKKIQQLENFMKKRWDR